MGTFLWVHLYRLLTLLSNGWCCSVWVDMKWIDLFKQKEESVTASSCGATALFPLTRAEWMMRHRIKIDCVHRPLYEYLMKLIFQCTLELFYKRYDSQWNLHCVFFFFYWGGKADQLFLGASNHQDHGKCSSTSWLKVSYKENNSVLEISENAACCERDGSGSFSCRVTLMITFQLAFPSSWELFQALSSRLSLSQEVGSPILLLGFQVSTH